MTKKEIQDRATRAVSAMQAQSKENGLDKLTDDEINAEIKAARQDRKRPDPPPRAPALNKALQERHHWNCDCMGCRPWTT